MNDEQPVAPSARRSPGRDSLELPGLSVGEWRTRVGTIVSRAGQAPFRSQQLLAWVFRRGASSFDSMSDLPASFRESLTEDAILHPLSVDVDLQSSDGTRKFLWRRLKGEAIESVVIPDGERTTYCISSQVGCPIACTFCATGFGGFSGQLSPAEIVDQVLSMRQLTGTPPTNVVFMGMGEPLLNMESVLQALEILCHPEQVGLGARRITVSTVGVPDRILELARVQPQVKLAVSLHATRDALRDEIIPLNRKYPLKELLGAVRTHHSITGKKVTFEYVVLPGVNDGDRDAEELGRLLAGIPSRINLLGFNPFPGAQYRKPSVRELTGFRESVVRHFPAAVTIRRSRGEDIQGACGQLSLSRG